jgi:transposase
MDELNKQGVEQIHKTFKYKLKPTAKQAAAMEFVVRRCRELYNAALRERKEAWEKRGVSITAASQSAQLPDIKAVRPEYRDYPLPGLAGRTHAPRPCLPGVLPACQER